MVWAGVGWRGLAWAGAGWCRLVCPEPQKALGQETAVFDRRHMKNKAALPRPPRAWCGLGVGTYGLVWAGVGWCGLV